MKILLVLRKHLLKASPFLLVIVITFFISQQTHLIAWYNAGRSNAKDKRSNLLKHEGHSSYHKSLESGGSLANNTDYQKDISHPEVRFGFRSLQESVDALNNTLPTLRHSNVLFVTSELFGPNLSSKLGKAVYKEASLISTHGANVTILYASKMESSQIQLWKKTFQKENLSLVHLENNTRDSYGTEQMQKSFEVYQWLKPRQSQFNVIYFNDINGLGLYTLYSKRAGQAFRNISLVVQNFGGTKLLHEIYALAMKDRNSLVTYFMERKSTEMADYTTYTTEFYSQWMQEMGYIVMKNRTFTLPNIVLHTNIKGKTSSPQVQPKPKATKTRNVCYYGKLDITSGAFLLVETLKYMLDRNMTVPEKVFFFGEKVKMGNQLSSSLLQSRLTASKLISSFSQPGMKFGESLESVKNSSCFVVLPLVGDAFFQTLSEVVSAELPVIYPTHRSLDQQLSTKLPAELSFTSGDKVSLSKAILKGKDSGVPIMKLRTSPEKSQQLHLKFLNYILNKPLKVNFNMEKDYLSKYKVTVVISSHNRPETLSELLDALLNQTYQFFKVLIVDSSTDSRVKNLQHRVTASFNKTNISIKFLFLKPCYIAEVRNKGMSTINTEYGILIDDDDIPTTDMVKNMLLTARRTKADVVTGFALNFRQTANKTNSKEIIRYSLSVGNAVEAEMFLHHAGKSNLLVKKAAYVSVGGCTVVPTGEESPYVDWDLYYKLMVHGYSLEVLPEVTFYYRMNSVDSIYYQSSKDYIKNYRGHLKIVKNFCKIYKINIFMCDTLIYANEKLSAPIITVDRN